MSLTHRERKRIADARNFMANLNDDQKKILDSRMKNPPAPKPKPQPIVQPTPFPTAITDALSRMEMKIDELIKKDAEVHKKLDEPKSNFEEMKLKAKEISKAEGVVQHVNRVSDGVYKIDDFYDADKTEVSYENGLKKD